MIQIASLGDRLRSARGTGGRPATARNRLFLARTLFCLAGAGVVSAVGSLIDTDGVLPASQRTVSLAIAASVVGLLLGAVELARCGSTHDTWAVLGLNLLVFAAALVLY